MFKKEIRIDEYDLTYDIHLNLENKTVMVKIINWPYWAHDINNFYEYMLEYITSYNSYDEEYIDGFINGSYNYVYCRFYSEEDINRFLLENF